jgi:GAF domain-containing protein
MPQQTSTTSAAQELDFGLFNKVHHANYGLFRARTEGELVEAVKAGLRLSPFVSGYFRVQADGLELVALFAPPKGKNVGGAPKRIPLSAPELTAAFGEELGISQLGSESGLPAQLRHTLVEAGCTSAAYIPIVETVEIVGVLVFGAHPGQTLSRATLEPFISQAELLPLALDKVRAGKAVQQRLRELEGISSVGQAISTAGSLDTLYHIIHQQVRETMGELSIIFALYDKSTDTIRIPYRFEDGELSALEPFPLGEGLTSILIRTHQPLMLVEDTERRAAELGAKIVGKPAKSWLGCPLLIAGEAIGAIIVQDTDREGRFSQDDLRFITSLSVQTAGAIYNTRLLDDARQRALQLQTAAEISRDVSGSLIVDELLQKAVNLIRERFNFYHAAIFLVDQSGEFAAIREASGNVGIQMKHAGHRLQVGSNSIVGNVTGRGEPLIVNETAKSPIYYPNPLLPDTRSESAIPIKVGSRIMGALDVQSTVPFAFNDENIKIIQILADQIAIALVNSELFADAQERLSQHRLLHHVTTSAASSTTIEEALTSAVQGLQVTLGGDQVAILLVDREGKNLEVKSAIGYADDVFQLRVPIGSGITGTVAEHRQALRVDDVTKDPRYIGVNERTRSEMAIPLIYRNEVLGVLNVESNQVNAYSENIEEMIGTLAGSLAAIIAHSRLLEQFRQQIEHDRLLYEISTKVRRSSNIQSILEITAEEISKAVGARRARISIDVGTSKIEPAPSIED